jgi:hypothetical protein
LDGESQINGIYGAISEYGNWHLTDIRMGSCPKIKWTAWDNSFEVEIVNIPAGPPIEWCEQERATYGKPFASHVNAAYMQAKIN